MKRGKNKRNKKKTIIEEYIIFVLGLCRAMHSCGHLATLAVIGHRNAPPPRIAGQTPHQQKSCPLYSTLTTRHLNPKHQSAQPHNNSPYPPTEKCSKKSYVPPSPQPKHTTYKNHPNHQPSPPPQRRSMKNKLTERSITATAKSKVKSSTQRAIRAKVAEQFPLLAPYLDEIMPRKVQLDVVKV
jgi:Pre-PUA-like domain